MQIRILGPLEVRDDGHAVNLGAPKQRALFAVLVLHVGEVVSVDRLIDALWPAQAPRTAAHSVQIYVSELRKLLAPLGGREVLVTRPPGYELRLDADVIDGHRFERLVDDGIAQLRAGQRQAGIELLRSALGLWGGPVLSDLEFHEFAQPHIRRLTNRHLDAAEELADALLAAGAPAEALAWAEIVIAEAPLRERSRELAMLALYRAGRHTEALRAYQHLRRHLAEELGLDPTPSLQRLEEQILLHDPDLIPERGDDPSSGAAPLNPYKGLRSFTEEDAADFFGRDQLVDQLVQRLQAGARFIALVGPSGVGKSSVVAAGLIPRLRQGSALAGSELWPIMRIVPGRHGVDLLDALASARTGGTAPTDPQRGAGDLATTSDAPTLLVVDQFEDIFAGDDAAIATSLHALTEAVSDPTGSTVVIAVLRADFYDRPLLDARFAEVFVPAVLNVLPLTTDELEAAVLRPATQRGVAVEARLVAALLADSATQPGTLPLVQHAMAELFDRREGGALTLAAYQALGGLRGMVSRRAELIYDELPTDQRSLAQQVFLRLVRPGNGAADSRRRVAVADLLAPDADLVALSSVLSTFGRNRLVTFDRDPETGRATVEVAHEALLREWPRLAQWIERHRAALRRLDALAAAAEDWDTSGRSTDYLLIGKRLDEHDTDGGAHAVIIHNAREQAFLAASRAQRTRNQQLEIERTLSQARLQRRARHSLIAVVVTVAMLVGGGWFLTTRTTAPPPKVALVHVGGGVFQWDSIIQQGYDRAVAEFGVVSHKEPVDSGRLDAAARLADEGFNLVVISALPTAEDPGAIDRLAEDHPETRFIVIDEPATSPNVTRLILAVNQGAFLAGVAAASTSRTGTIGFIGGADTPTIWSWEAGYTAGAHAVNPDIEILAATVDPGGCDCGFNNIPGATLLATAQYDAGADVILHAAGDSSLGGFAAAAEVSERTGIQRWAIGADADQYNAIAHNGTIGPVALEWQPHILTSVLKRTDIAVHHTIESVANGQDLNHTQLYGLRNGGVGLSRSGGFLDQQAADIDTWTQRVADGEIAVPCIPDRRLDQARLLGLTQTHCIT